MKPNGVSVRFCPKALTTYKLYGEEERLKHRLATIELELRTYAKLDRETKAIDYVAKLQVGMKELNNANSHSPEEQHRVFLLKKQLVDELLAEAIIDGERDIQVEFRARIIDLTVNKELLDFPNSGEIVEHNFNKSNTRSTLTILDYQGASLLKNYSPALNTGECGMMVYEKIS